jgi:putative serine protease PepD
MVALSLAVALAVLFLAPLAFGANPIDVLQGRGKTQTVTQTQIVNPQTGKTAIEAVAAKIMPSVVNIDVTVQGGFGQTGEGIASGFFFRDGGYILTNNHVAQGATSITVTTADGKDFKAKVIGTDPDTDLAVIQVSGATAPVADRGSSAGLQVGQEVVAVGSPAGLEQTVTQGIVSALHRNLPDFHPSNAPNTTPLLDVIQTDAAINPGNSGGPLVDMSGNVVGVNSAIYSESGGSEGLGFSIPIDTAKAIADQLVSSGSVSHAWLGISGQTVTPALAQANGLSVDYGALIADVYAGSSAAQAGLQRGDIIIALDGTKMASMDQLMLYVRGKSAGSKLTVTYMRGSDRHDVDVTLQAKSGT